MLTQDQKEKILSICEAYELGYSTSSDKNPFYINDSEYVAWEIGHKQSELDYKLLENRLLNGS
jgi:hypothetical protein